MRVSKRMAVSIAVATAAAGTAIASGLTNSASADPMCEAVYASGAVNYGTGTCVNSPTPVFCDSGSESAGVETVWSKECVPA